MADSDVFTEISALLDTEDSNVASAIDAENQRHQDALAPLTKRQGDLGQVRATLSTLEAQSAEPTPALTETPATPPLAGDAADSAPADGGEAVAAVAPDPSPAAASSDLVELRDPNTGVVQTVPAADVLAATDPSVPDEALTPPQRALRNSDFR